MNSRHLILAAAGKKVWTDPLDITADIFTLPAGAVDGQMDTVVKANMDGTVGTGAVTITSCGKNLCNISGLEVDLLNQVDSFNVVGDAIQVTTSSSDLCYTYAQTKKIKLKPNTAYYIGCNSVKTPTDSTCGLSVKDAADTTITLLDRANYKNPSGTFTTPASGEIKLRFYGNGFTVGAGTVTFSSITLTEGSTATAYEPYKYSKATLPAVGKRIGEVYDEINIPEGLHIQRINGDAVLETPITTPISIPIETNGIADSVLRAWKNGTVSVEYEGALPTISYSYPTLPE